MGWAGTESGDLSWKKMVFLFSLSISTTLTFLKNIDNDFIALFLHLHSHLFLPSLFFTPIFCFYPCLHQCFLAHSSPTSCYLLQQLHEITQTVIANVNYVLFCQECITCSEWGLNKCIHSSDARDRSFSLIVLAFSMQFPWYTQTVVEFWAWIVFDTIEVSAVYSALFKHIVFEAGPAYNPRHAPDEFIIIECFR